ncbi:hypothetical protein [Thioalkalivibrio versutus]|uniref:hypothetical protein n=1 Tax=Thioalkalivibrio versutus TaxID=106634 RepID=UPI000A447007|nr:hypothetical protein [Thioalkalivibrio versutus]
MENSESVFRASSLLVKHFKDCIARGGKGRHSRVFTYFLHPEEDFVSVGQSQEILDGQPAHPEHVVPCSVLIEEACRLLEQGTPEEDVARLLSKHWKIVFVSKNQAAYLGSKEGLNMKHCMPNGWNFENGDTYERLREANIEWFPLEGR